MAVNPSKGDVVLVNASDGSGEIKAQYMGEVGDGYHSFQALEVVKQPSFELESGGSFNTSESEMIGIIEHRDSYDPDLPDEY